MPNNFDEPEWDGTFDWPEWLDKARHDLSDIYWATKGVRWDPKELCWPPKPIQKKSLRTRPN